jgi:hypothetical protein
MMKWQFRFGHVFTTPVQYAVIGAALATLVVTLHRCTGISTNTLKRVIDQVQRHFAPGGRVNDYIIRDPEWLNTRVKGDVDDAIEKYKRQTGWKATEIPKGIYSEKSVDSGVCYTEECRTLGGEMRICSPWVYDCPQTLKTPSV